MNPAYETPLALRKLTKREREAKYGVPPESFDDDIAFLSDWRPDRISDKIAGLDERDTKTLDELLERYGLERIVKGLHSLSESRAPSVYDTGCTFEDVSHGDEWNERAAALETLLARIVK